MCPTDEDDTELFRQATRDVRRAKPSERADTGLPKPKASARQQQLDDAEVLRELLMDPDPDVLEHGETLQYRAPGQPESVLRRLRRGDYRIEANLDLHGHNRFQAHAALNEFLAECQHHGQHSVRIVHGKGNGSPNSGPVIKRLLDSWLRKRKDVIAYCSARQVDGGSGAIYVLLRTR
ncbi:MAG: Smr/MutS family protein [Pseudomonadota bacterium]|nr:Smr/MutS family protein [Pseudomonadota bacterium]